MGHRELDGGGPERDLPAFADIGDPPGPFDDIRRRRRVVEPRLRRRIGQHAAVHHAGDQHRHAALRAGR
jgi:hypothetical protein